MPNLNQVTLIGHVGKEPELKYTQSGSAVCQLSLAVNRGYGDFKKTVWLQVAIWGKAAETASTLIHKGSTVLICGELNMDEWEDKATGQRRSKITVWCDSWQLLDKREATRDVE